MHAPTPNIPPDRAKKKEPPDKIAIVILPPFLHDEDDGAAKSDDTMDYDTPHILENFHYVHSHAIPGSTHTQMSKSLQP